ncbi:MAG: hypothetical protein ABSD99_06750, partial [Candidatus Bathyarchaeia archaeon]
SPIVIGGFVYAYLNVVRFGSPLSFGYGALSSVTSEAVYGTNPLIGIFGLLFSSGEGVFIYYPLSALGIFTLFINRRDNNWARFMFVWIFLATLLFYSRYNYWDGWWAWGARYLVPTMPYLILGVGPFIESARHSIMRIIVVVSATAIGIFSNLMGVLINLDSVMGYLGSIGAFNAAPQMGVFPRFYPGIWMPEFSQVRGSWDLLWSHMRLDLLLYNWLGPPALAVALLLLLVEACWLVRSLKRINKEL